MNFMGKLISNVTGFYSEINAATLTGAIDVVVVEQPDGTLISSPFHVRFGKLGVMRSREKIVDMEINEEPVEIHMKLGDSGEGYFVEELGEGEEEDEVPAHLACSPIPPLGDISDELEQICDNPESLCDDVMEPVVVIADTKVTPQTFTAETVETCVVNTSQEFRPIKEDDEKVSSIEEVVVPKDDQPEINNTPEIITKPPVTSTPNIESPIDGNVVVEQQTVKVTKKRRKRRPRKQKNKVDTSVGTTSSIEDESTETTETSGTESSVKQDPSPKKKKIEETLKPKIEPEDKVDRRDSSSSSDDVELKAICRSSTTQGLKDANVTPEPSMSREPFCQRTQSMGPNFHYFSDTELSPVSSPLGSRPSSPIQSDTEFEVKRQASVSIQTNLDEEQGTWKWGELPSTASTPRSALPPSSIGVDMTTDGSQKEEEQRSLLSGMLSFMRKTKKIRHDPESEGIYLDDLNADDMDPEVAALYFPRQYRTHHEHNGFNSGLLKDEDTESGNGPSLPHSPHSVEGAIGGVMDSDFEDSKHFIFEHREFRDLAVSRCGFLPDCDEVPVDLFHQSMVTYDDLVLHPQIFDDPNLVVRMNGKYYNWKVAAPMVMSILLYQRPLSETVKKNLVDDFMPKKKEEKKEPSGYKSWFPWPSRRKTYSENFEKENVEDKVDIQPVAHSVEVGGVMNIVSEPNKSDEKPAANSEDSSTQTNTSDFNPTDTSPPTVSIENMENTENIDNNIPETFERKEEKVEKCRKSLRLSSDQLKQLNLNPGMNTVVFSVTTAYQGTSQAQCCIFKWKYDDKIVVSDIDGTITRSDVLGHILPIIGKDWAQSGVTQLFTNIKNNGYRFLYLSARAIGQAHVTREYLKSVKQGDLSLPDGPVMLNPTSLLNAFHREVIEKKPEEFKIKCLKDIQELFPMASNPFYAGYGNKVNDVYAYRAIGIPISRIFTINHKGELKHELTNAFQSSYSSLSFIADHFFPPHDQAGSRWLHEVQEFSQFKYWRDPLPDIDVAQLL